MASKMAKRVGIHVICCPACRTKYQRESNSLTNLAKNAGTSVEQIERFYTKHLRHSREWRKTCKALAERERSAVPSIGL